MTSNVDREIVITRTLNAPRDLVFKTWTDPKHIGHWWGPKGFTITTLEMNVRPGGVWRFVMHGPNGVDYQNTITYLELINPERIVYAHGSNEEDGFQVTVAFEEQDNKTQLTMTMLFPSLEARNKAIEEVGAIKGGNQTLDRLEEFLATF